MVNQRIDPGGVAGTTAAALYDGKTIRSDRPGETVYALDQWDRRIASHVRPIPAVTPIQAKANTTMDA